MSGVTVVPMTNVDEDPDCFHCKLAPIVAQFANQHPEKPHMHIMGEIAQTLGEMIGSALINSGTDVSRAEILAFVGKELNETIDAMLRSVPGGRPQ
jgi:hypothetical protein